MTTDGFCNHKTGVCVLLSCLLPGFTVDETPRAVTTNRFSIMTPVYYVVFIFFLNPEAMTYDRPNNDKTCLYSFLVRLTFPNATLEARRTTNKTFFTQTTM